MLTPDELRVTREGHRESQFVDAFERYEKVLKKASALDLRRPAAPGRHLAARARPDPREVRRTLPARPGRRVPGHQPRAVRADAPARRQPPQRLRRRRPRPGHLRLARRRHRQHPEVHRRLPRTHRRPPRTQLPLQRQHRRRRSRAHRPQQGTGRQDAVDGTRQGRRHRAPADRDGPRRGNSHRGHRPGRAGHPPADRRALPHQRAVAPGRGHAAPRRDPLPHRRPTSASTNGGRSRTRSPT